MDIDQAIDMLSRLERMALELEPAGVRVVVEVRLDTVVRLEPLAVGLARNTAPQVEPCPIDGRMEVHQHGAQEWRDWEAGNGTPAP